jgi:lysophospholipase L1-like esterase
LALLALLALPGAATAREPAPVEIGKVSLGRATDGRAALLVPVRYPIQLNGQRVELRVTLRGRGVSKTWAVRGRAHGGALRTPERRRAFRFVHEARLSRKLSRRVQRGVRVEVLAHEALDVEGDRRADVTGSDRELQRLSGGAPRRLCADLPLLRTRPGRLVRVQLPSCGSKARWRVAGGAELSGRARIAKGSLIYVPRPSFRGTESIDLRGRVRGGGRASTAAPQVKVGFGQGVSVRAIGDSVTAGFGYYDDGSPMEFTSLLSCKPGKKTYDDACSSNSLVREDSAPAVEYAPDYGLSNNISWAAQWANEHGVRNYANFAVSGSEPSDWSPGGQFHPTTKRVIEEEPDYIVLTLGANPLLADMLFGVDEMGCAIWSDVFGKYRECVEEAFAEVELRANLARLYAELVNNTSATIFLMQYHLSVPASALAYSATQIAMMGAMLNQEIASVAAEVRADRLLPVAPPHFDVGIDISPVYPSTFTCSSLGYLVDGSSVQSDPTQDELRGTHPFSFCPGPAEGPPWVIGADTGIHPSAAGYAQMAAALPAPR